MKKAHLVDDLARTQGTNTAEAADKLDKAITKLIRDLKRGHEAHLPGIGRIIPGDEWTLLTEDAHGDGAQACGHGTSRPKEGGHDPGDK